MTASSTGYRQNFGPFAPEVYHTPFPYEYRGIDRPALTALQSLFDSRIAPAQVAAIIIEPQLGEGGFVPAPVEFLRELRRMYTAHGIVLIADEIQTGFGRTGRMFAYEHSGIEPDLVTMAKSLGGGMPLSAVVGKAAIMDAPAVGGLGGTYAGNPLACAAALAVLDVFEEEHVLEQAAPQAETTREALTALGAHPQIGDVRGLGAMQAIEIVQPADRGADSASAQQIVELARSRGLLLLKSGTYKNVIRLLPPLTTPPADLRAASTCWPAPVPRCSHEPDLRRPEPGHRRARAERAERRGRRGPAPPPQHRRVPGLAQSHRLRALEILRAVARLMLQDEDRLARLMTEEMGKPITESRGEVKYAAAFVEWYAEEAKRVYGETVPSQFTHKRLLVRPQPVGPVYAVTPWNFPAAMVTRKAAPALAAGCTVVLKPAEQSPLTALRLEELWREAGGPADVFQVLTTVDPAAVSAVFFDDPAIRKLTFTGSTEVGILLAAQAAKTVKRVSLELGGHAPFLVFDDADLDAAVREVVASKFRNTGQTCVCANRIYVQAGVYDAFGDRLPRPSGGCGWAIRPIRPPTSAAGRSRRARQGAGPRPGRHCQGRAGHGGRSAARGLFFDPTVLTDVAPGMRILRKRPSAQWPRWCGSPPMPRRSAANGTPFGLAAYLWTRDLTRAFRVSEALDFGIVGVNDGVPSTPQAPFGGVKASGLGREGGKWGIEEYLDLKYVSIALG